jgi:hypothetical protein
VTLGGPAEGHAQLHHVWVDGQRGPIEVNRADVNVAISGGNGSEVFGCRINHSAGWTNILADGASAGAPCELSSIRRNLITEYTSCHSKPDGPDLWVDGISSSCENALIEENQIVDATDVGIVIFRGTETTTQRSVARGNSVLAAGNAAWGALAADPMFGPYARVFDFTGTRFENNWIWSGDGHFDIGLSVGTATLAFGDSNEIGRGATFVDNSVGWPALACSARVDLGIAVSGMLDATVTGNRLGLELVDLGNCPGPGPQCGPLNPPPATAAVVASYCSGLASGTIQDALDFQVLRCLGHFPHPNCADGFNATTTPARWPGGTALTPTLDVVFPNPTRGQVVVGFTVPVAEMVQVELLDLAGRRLAHRDAGRLGPGRHEVTFDETDRFRPGIYVVKVRQGLHHRIRQVVVLS